MRRSEIESPVVRGLGETGGETRTGRVAAAYPAAGAGLAGGEGSVGAASLTISACRRPSQ